jgi:GNAT superfamily N-acetyltransferase
LAAVDVGRPALGANVATLLAPLFAEDASEIMAVLDEFYGLPFGDRFGAVFLFSPWPTPDLRAHGWDLVEYQPLMLRQAGGTAPPLPAGLRVEVVRDEVGLLAFAGTMVRGFQLDELEGHGPGAAFGAEILTDERQRLWVGWEEDRPVSAAATFVAEGINGVTLVATVPEARGRGYGTALTWQATLADAALPALLIATPEGRAVYERMGYQSLFRFAVWSRERPSRIT